MSAQIGKGYWHVTYSGHICSNVDILFTPSMVL